MELEGGIQGGMVKPELEKTGSRTLYPLEDSLIYHLCTESYIHSANIIELPAQVLETCSQSSKTFISTHTR